MSIALPSVDLTSASLGTNGTISFNSIGVGQGGISAAPALRANPPYLNVFNDSKFQLLITFQQSGYSDHLSAGAWRSYPLQPGESGVKWQVEAVMNVNAPIAQLMATFYFPYEQVPGVGTLGNSPIGGGVQTTSIQTLSNEGGARGLTVVDIGDLAISNLWDIFTDHFTISVDQAGIAHQVLNGQTAGNPLQIGQAGDISEILGKLQADQLLTAQSGISVTASGLIVVGGTSTDTLSVSGTSTFTGNDTHNGNIIANGGENVNTIRDNVAGNAAMDLSAGDGTVAFLQLLKPNAAGAVHNGTSGSFTAYYPIWGSGLKVAIITLNAYLNATTTVGSSFPSVMNALAFGAVNGFGSATPTFSLFRSGVAVNVSVFTALASGGGTTSPQNTIHQNSFFMGAGLQAYDQIFMGANFSGAANAVIVLVGN